MLHVSDNYTAQLREHYTVCKSFWYKTPTNLLACSLEAEEFRPILPARNNVGALYHNLLHIV